MIKLDYQKTETLMNTKDRNSRVTKRAVEVFGDMDRADIWMNTPNQALNAQTPLSLLDTDIGTKNVMDILGRIEHGIVV